MFNEAVDREVQAEEIINTISSQTNGFANTKSVLSVAAEQSVKGLACDRCVIWRVRGNLFEVATEYVATGNDYFGSPKLNEQESTNTVLEFLSRLPDGSGDGTVSIPDVSTDSGITPTLASHLKTANVKARLLAQLRIDGIFAGMVELQECKATRNWTKREALILQQIAAAISHSAPTSIAGG